MDLVASAIGMKQAATMAKVQYAVAGKIMDQQRSNGNAMLKLISAANVGVNRAGDQMAAAATGLGGSLDVQA
ncbi:MAG TPA: putative motility protein [Tepidisphaeraceae bacterium]|jgi:hypothetical protein